MERVIFVLLYLTVLQYSNLILQHTNLILQYTNLILQHTNLILQYSNLISMLKIVRVSNDGENTTIV